MRSQEITAMTVADPEPLMPDELRAIIGAAHKAKDPDSCQYQAGADCPAATGKPGADCLINDYNLGSGNKGERA